MAFVETRPVFIAWTNTDLTEGRGAQIPLCICASRTTAERRGRGKYVQGTDCNVTEEIGIKYKNQWYYRGHLILPSSDDTLNDAKAKEREEILDKALSLGLTQEDIEKLKRS